MKKRFINTWVILAAACMLFACNDKKKGKTTPQPGEGDQVGVEPGLGGPVKPKLKLTTEEKASYEKAVKIYLEASAQAERAGGWKDGMCDSPAQAFAKVASDNPRLFTYGKHNEGMTWLHCGNKDRATSAFNAALGKNSNFAPSLVSMGYLDAAKGNTAGAFRNFERAFISDMRNAEASFNLGVIYRERERGGEKLTPGEIDRLNSLRTPQGHFAYRDWIAQLRGQRITLDYKELALRHLRTVLAITSGSTEPNANLLNLKAYTMIALVYTDAAEQMQSQLALANLVVQEAEKLIEEYVEKAEKEKLPPLCRGKDPTTMDKAVAELKNVQGLMALRRPEPDLVAGMRHFTEAVSCDPNFWEAHMNIGAIALSFRGYDRAQTSFEVVLRQRPDYPDAVMGLGVAYRGLSALAMGGEKDKAIELAQQQYQKVMSLVSPQEKLYADALYNLGLLRQDYMISDTDEETIKRLRSAQGYFEKYVKHPRAVKTARENASSRSGDIDRTIKIMQQMAELQKQQAERERQQRLQEKREKREQKEKKEKKGK